MNCRLLNLKSVAEDIHLGDMVYICYYGAHDSCDRDEYIPEMINCLNRYGNLIYLEGDKSSFIIQNCTK